MAFPTVINLANDIGGTSMAPILAYLNDYQKSGYTQTSLCPRPTIKWHHYGLFGSESPMPTTLILKNIPDEVYERLKQSAVLHRRSLNSEAILCLKTALVPINIPPSERLARAKALRAKLPQKKYSIKIIDADKCQGRP